MIWITKICLFDVNPALTNHLWIKRGRMALKSQPKNRGPTVSASLSIYLSIDRIDRIYRICGIYLSIHPSIHPSIHLHPSIHPSIHPPILSYPILSYPTLSYPILSYPILCIVSIYRIVSYPILSSPSLSYLSIWFYLSISPYLAVCICIGSMNRFVWQRKTEFAEDNVQAIQQSSKIQLHSSKSWCNMCKHFPCLAYTFQPLISITALP